MTGILDIDLKSSGIAKVLQLHRLRVPPYQRPYAWRDEHVNTLFDDWSDAYKIKSKEKHYFLGTIVLNRTPNSEILEVSDGQQRLATTAMFIAAIRDVLSEGGQQQKTTAEKYTSAYLTGFEELEGDWVSKLQLNTQDNSYFMDAVLVPPGQRSANAKSSQRRASAERIARAYDLARERVDALMGEVTEQYKYRHLYEWMNFLQNNVAVVVITVPEDVDGYTMFETLNDRGLRTSQVDNIKNRLFKESGSRLAEIEDKWLSMLAQIESFGDDETTISYIRHYWISHNGPTRQQELARRFKESVQGQAAAASLIEQLDRHAVDYEALFYAPLEHKRLLELGPDARGHIAASTRVLGIEQIRPLMMAVLTHFSTEEAKKAFQLMLSWSVRFIVVGAGGGGTMERNYGLLAQRVSLPSSDITKITKARELRGALDAPTDPQFEAAFRTYSISNSEIARYIMRSLEAHKRSEREPGIQFFENPNTLNLEHILPREASGWSIPADVAKGYFKRVGNLTLLDPVANTKIGNGLFDTKKPIYAKSPFLLTRELASYAKWDVAEIENRQAELASYAPKVWPLTWT
jgi:hypothetical protein